MSSALRLSIIAVLLLATAALGLIAFNMNAPKADRGRRSPACASGANNRRLFCRGASAAERHIGPRGGFHGALGAAGQRSGRRDSRYARLQGRTSRFTGPQVRRGRQLPSPCRTSCVRSDRGFLASVLAPDSRAISIKVDEESGVSGLIRPGDHVDVVLTQMFEKRIPHVAPSAKPFCAMFGSLRSTRRSCKAARRYASKGATGASMAQTVSLELTPEQVKKITVAKQLGKLSLAVRAAVDRVERAGQRRRVELRRVAGTRPPECGRRPAAAIAVHVRRRGQAIHGQKAGHDDTDARLSRTVDAADSSGGWWLAKRRRNVDEHGR